MTQTYILRPSKKQFKKYDLVDEDGKVISFGQKNASDFTINKDHFRKARYIVRHQKNERHLWSHTAELSPSYLSRYLLWQEPNLTDAIKFVERHRNIKIIHN